MPLAVGVRFGPYEIVSALGAGGMGEVYRARDNRLGRTVAIKILRQDAVADPARVNRFEREARSASALNHPNIVTIYDVGVVDSTSYIAMEWIDGASLRDVLAGPQKQTIADIVKIGAQIAEGLAKAHSAGIVHRDLKPDNVMVTGDGLVKILDFGLAKLAAPASDLGSQLATKTEGTAAGVLLGTVGYMSPEQAVGAAVDYRSDQFSLGIILYELATGSRAFRRNSAPQTLAAIIEDEPERVETLNPRVPPQLSHIIARCLAKKPDDRYESTRDLARDLRDVINETSTTINAAPAARAKRVVGPRTVAAVAVGIVGLAAGTWWLMRTPPPSKPHDPVSVLIADFQNQTNDPSFDHTLEPVFKLALEGAGFISAYDRVGIRTLGVRPPERLDERGAQEIAVKQAVGVVLAGALTREGSGYGLTVKMIQAVTGNVIATTTEKASDKDKVLAVAMSAATAIRKALGDNRSDSAQRFAMDTLSTANLDAVHDYAMGQLALADSRHEDAIRSYAQAIERDPNFVAAYTGIALASSNIGRQQDAEKYAKEALKHLDRATERERYRVRGALYRLTGDYQHCVNEYSALVARYTADVAARNQLALCMSKLRQLSAARDEMRRVSGILPQRALYRINLSLYASYGGDYQTGEASARDALNLSPSTEYGFVALAFAQIGQNRIPQAVETLQKLASLSPLGASLSASALADIAVYEGRFTEAASILERSAAADLAAGNRDRAAMKWTALAYTRLQQKETAKAVAATEQALKSSQVANIRFFAGRVLIEANEIAKAKVLAAGLAAEPQTEPRALAKILEADAGLKNKTPKQAIALLTEANTLLDTWIAHFDLGRAYFDNGALLQADSEFDGCLRRRGEALSLLLDEEPTFGYVPPVYYYQGRVREGLKTEAFAESYRVYLGIREKAGEDPLVAEVRRRAGR